MPIYIYYLFQMFLVSEIQLNTTGSQGPPLPLRQDNLQPYRATSKKQAQVLCRRCEVTGHQTLSFGNAL